LTNIKNNNNHQIRIVILTTWDWFVKPLILVKVRLPHWTNLGGKPFILYGVLHFLRYMVSWFAIRV